MSQLTEIVIKAGIIPQNALAEAKRWRAPIVDDVQPPTGLEAVMSIDQLVAKIDEAIQSEGYVLTRETDLGVIGQYLQTMKEATLHIVLEDGKPSNFTVHVGVNTAGEFIIPWRSDNIGDLLTNGESYLKVGKEKIFFCNARELFYGDNKAFVVCTPSTKEPDGNRH